MGGQSFEVLACILQWSPLLVHHSYYNLSRGFGELKFIKYIYIIFTLETTYCHPASIFYTIILE